jgi:hypothetical protein
MAPVLINLCVRVKPAFDKDNSDIRAAAIKLFGSLHRFGQDLAADAFYEQIHNNLPSLVLHMNDDSEPVRSVCPSPLV